MADQAAVTREVIFDADSMREALRAMAARLLASARADQISLVGIQRRGVPLAQRLRQELAPTNPEGIPLGILDITLYRDDLSSLGPQPIVGPTHIPFDVDGHTIVLVDDVLFTGRTVRAALEALLAFGRPRAVRLAVLVDRGHREIPIQADVAGFTVETTPGQVVEVHLAEIDGDDGIELVTREEERSP
jgi:pyrimidine operon attenuation protein/uracil phosphoribosyltransferase